MKFIRAYTCTPSSLSVFPFPFFDTLLPLIITLFIVFPNAVSSPTSFFSFLLHASLSTFILYSGFKCELSKHLHTLEAAHDELFSSSGVWLGEGWEILRACQTCKFHRAKTEDERDDPWVVGEFMVKHDALFWFFSHVFSFLVLYNINIFFHVFIFYMALQGHTAVQWLVLLPQCKWVAGSCSTVWSL